MTLLPTAVMAYYSVAVIHAVDSSLQIATAEHVMTSAW